MPKMTSSSAATAPSTSTRRSRGERASRAASSDSKVTELSDSRENFMGASRAAGVHLDETLVTGGGVVAAGEVRLPAVAAQRLAHLVEARRIGRCELHLQRAGVEVERLHVGARHAIARLGKRLQRRQQATAGA